MSILRVQEEESDSAGPDVEAWPYSWERLRVRLAKPTKTPGLEGADPDGLCFPGSSV